jgi:hypothetical protein
MTDHAPGQADQDIPERGWDSEVLCGAWIDRHGTEGKLCKRIEGHQGPHSDSPIPMGMTAAEWEKFVRSYR